MGLRLMEADPEEKNLDSERMDKDCFSDRQPLPSSLSRTDDQGGTIHNFSRHFSYCCIHWALSIT